MEDYTTPAFPVIWDSSQEAEDMWILDQIHCPKPICRLDYQLRLHPLLAASNRINIRLGLPISSEPKLINGYIYGRVVTDDLDPATLPRVLQACDEKVRRGYTELSRSWEEIWLPRIQEHLAGLAGVDIAGAPFPDLCSHVGVVRERVESLWELHQELLMPLMMAIHDFEETFRDLFPNAGPLAAFDLLGGLPNKTTETNLKLWELGGMAAQDADLLASVSEDEISTLPQRLAQTEKGVALWSEIEAFLRVYGERNDSLLLDDPTWIDDPTSVLRGLREAALQPERDLVADFSLLAQAREEKVLSLRAELATLPAAVTAEFEHLLAAAQVATVLSEDHHFWIDCKITHHARRVALELGRRLQERDLLDARLDVFHLGIDELVALADAIPDQDALRRRVALRKAEQVRFSDLQPPLVLGRPKQLLPMDCALLRISVKFSGNIIQAPAPAGESLVGMPPSSGVVIGPARIVSSLKEVDKLCPGDILVTAFTLPSWTPFFASVAGLVTNIGGMLSHAAVMAREYRIPAVVGTVSATETFSDGQLIAVDGDAGTVRVVSEAAR